MLDVLILGGTVVDGTGKPGRRADVGISGERIEAIGNLSNAETRRVIDATGLTVSPGFIDTHAHSDGALLVDPQHANGLRQGITTEILGQDGLSYAPLSRENFRMYRHYLSGLLGFPPEELDMGSVEAFRAYYQYVGINTAYLVPHGAVRLETVGFRDVPLVGDDLEAAKRIVQEGIEQGAVGFSTGLSYYPNSYSDTQELIELCRACHEAGGVYVTHIRNANVERGFGGGGVAEALEIGRRSGVRVHFSHYRTTPANPGQVAQIMAQIDQAKAEGVDCTLELYPYPTGSGYPLYYFPGWFHEGGPEAMLSRLRDASQRARLVVWLDDRYTGQWEDTVFTFVPSEKNRGLEGMSWADVAKQRGVSIAAMLCDLLVE
ncbi:MAG: amidohydrolase family protein, partial [Chloroflexota bacterium]|nr:amidohydrolase family protein [Chloroflexota bacterium]